MAKPAVTEKDFQGLVLELAQTFAWTAYHTHDSRMSAAGFPDLVLVRDRVVFAELKVVGKKPGVGQVEWLDKLVAADAETYLWTIDDLGEITLILGAHHRVRAVSAWQRRREDLARGSNLSERVPRPRRAP